MGSWTLLCVTLLLHVNGGYSIVGGKDAQRGAWPWMVHIEANGDGVCIHCGGSLVSEQWVMTAGRCWRDKYNVEDSFVRVGAHSLKEHSGRLVKLKRVITHPEFFYDKDKHIFFNDITLVQLTEPVSFSDSVTPVALPSPRDVFTSDSECWVTGWGAVTYDRDLDGKKTLQEVQLSLVDDVTCLQLYPNKTDGHLCAGDLGEEKGPCHGDQGDPLVCVPDGEVKRRFVQVGIFIGGKGKCVVSGVYTIVFKHTQFILDTICRWTHIENNDLTDFEACFL